MFTTLSWFLTIVRPSLSLYNRLVCEFSEPKAVSSAVFRLYECVCGRLLTATALLRSHKDQLSSHRIMMPSRAVEEMGITTKSAHTRVEAASWTIRKLTRLFILIVI